MNDGKFFIKWNIIFHLGKSFNYNNNTHKKKYDFGFYESICRHLGVIVLNEHGSLRLFVF